MGDRRLHHHFHDQHGLLLLAYSSVTIKGGRQWATTLGEIRRDHVERYLWASHVVTDYTGSVSDLGCGIGYGSFLMASADRVVSAFDVSEEALEFARRHWHHPKIFWHVADLADPPGILTNSSVCFELIEHLADPRPLLCKIYSRHLIASVPNEAVMPWDAKRHDHHARHYTKDQFAGLLGETGWTVAKWFTQKDKTSPVAPGDDGLTLIAECRR